MIRNPQTLTPDKFLKKLPLVLAGIAFCIYISQSIIFTQIRLPNLDEGAYLYKGLQYALGTYQPFQPYGFWTNKMYLTFYLYGWVQQLFTPGLLAPRLFAVFLGSLSVAGMWMTVKRLSNNWLAAIAVWVLALNPTMISIYSIGNSQVVIIFLLVWTMFFVLGENRRDWQIYCSAFLVGVMVLCRENMVFVLPFLLFYIFWQHGSKKGLIASGILGIVLLIGHLIFWPDILYLWARQIPFVHFNQESIRLYSVNTQSSEIPIITRIHSLSLAIRVFFIPIAALFVTILMWVKRLSWRSQWQYKASVFLTITLVVLAVAHIWASTGKNYCVYCATNYFAFFAPLGLVLISTAYSSISRNHRKISTILLAISIPITSAFFGFSYFEQFGYTLMNIAVPRFNNSKFLPGTVALWQLLNNKFHLSYEAARYVIPAMVGLLVGLLFLFIFWLLLHKPYINQNGGRTWHMAQAVLIAGLLLTPLLSWPTQETFSETSVTKTYQQIGLALANIVQSDSQIYLDGKIAAIPLLYTKDIKILPAQINGDYSFVNNPDTDSVSAQGLWNQEIAQRWKEQSDIFLIGEENLADWQFYIQTSHLVEVPVDNDYSEMPEFSKISIFKRP